MFEGIEGRANGTFVAANAVPGRDYPLVADIITVVYGKGQGNMQNPERVGTAYYNRGVGAAMMWNEAMKNAQRIHRKIGKAINGAEFRDGYEALDMTDAKLKEIGIQGPARVLAENKDVKEFYLGLSSEGRTSFRNMKSYRRRTRWL